MSDDIYKDIAQAYAAAAEKAPGLKSRFTAAGFDPAAVTSVADLSRLPVMKKEELLKIQRENPPFGGFLASDLKDIGRIYVSPGPIFEPALSGEGGHGLDLLFKAAGVGPGDIILNTWMYHLVPAGLLFDEAAQAAGATVIPGGVGNTELQAQIIVETGVTSICASTAFFLTLADKVIETYGRDAWKVKTAFLGGEMGDWMAKRRRIEAEYGVSTWAAYATADLGLVAYEDGGEGYLVHPDRVVQICDPVSGEQVAHGEPGEVVVTARDATWPMIRFGTGDSAFALESNADGTVSRISALQGRVGAAVKVREIFVYPRVVEEVVIGTPGAKAAQAVVTRENDRDMIRLSLVLEDGADASAAEAAAAKNFKLHTRIRVDEVNIVSELPENAELIVNQKDR
ncbi:MULTISPECIES: phenylacetate--CoA ligase family protein [Rhodobacterales]|nr:MULTISPECIES: phenylacetate--CoA ligase family protein [Rhodobacterales]MCR8550405.1 phenylacetate--CoA ligase family protein [Salipiger pentaromativorans]WBU54915.1 phenylacetate--CoA ligase family protein [Paracoccus sp. SCSIO 75233]SDO51184.1 phenylacetate-CoA ligase [Lutimaribacter pacificus]SFT71648.1 phenylacetate-CoA ligase [Sedimentitalea nanhaiensis]SHK66221.1 phenylacetate-CoA ligase [Lutimaribacter pacificus]